MVHTTTEIRALGAGDLAALDSDALDFDALDFDALDFDALARAEVVLFDDDPWSAAAFAELTQGPGRRLLVAVREDETVGYVLTGVVGDFVDLLRIGVLPQAQRHGVASALLDAAVQTARLDGAERMLLEVSTGNAAARAFYARHGFVEIDRRARYYRDGESAVVLQRHVAPLDLTLSASGKMEP